MMKIENKSFNGEIVEVKEMDLNGKRVGIVKGYLATWHKDIQSGIYGMPDIIVKGAYTKSIQEFKARNNRTLKMKRDHYQVIGGFPINTLKEDNRGLYGEGEINLDTQLGRETYSLALQKVLVDFSIGHFVRKETIEDNTRKILDAELFEASIVEEPKNRYAQITEIKSASPLLEPMDSKINWNEEEALERVLELKYRDGSGSDAFIGGVLVADVVDGKLKVHPDALRRAAAEVKSTTDQLLVERYFAKLGLDSPFSNKLFYTLDDVKSLSKAEIKSLLIDSGIFSNGAARLIVAKMADDVSSPENDGLKTLLERIQSISEVIK
jgi:HK97 family phage prohead protease